MNIVVIIKSIDRYSKVMSVPRQEVVYIIYGGRWSGYSGFSMARI